LGDKWDTRFPLCSFGSTEGKSTIQHQREVDEFGGGPEASLKPPPLHSSPLSRELSRGTPPRLPDLGRGRRARSDLDEEDQRDPTDRSEGEANGRRARYDPSSRPVIGGRRS
jgi:hypothetical protein